MAVAPGDVCYMLRYMNKIAVGPKAKGKVNLDMPIEEILKN